MAAFDRQDQVGHCGASRCCSFRRRRFDFCRVQYFFKVLSSNELCGFAFLIVGLLIAVAVYYKYARNSNNKGNGNKDAEIDKLMKTMKRDLEKSRNEIKVQLDELEGHREENKKSLQSVEKETTVDKPEEFLREKEKLLNEQWGQDQRKKNLEKQLLDYEKLLEPIEIFIGRDTALIR